MANILIIRIFLVLTTLLIGTGSYGRDFLDQEEVTQEVGSRITSSAQIEKYIAELSKKDDILVSEKEIFISKNRKLIERSVENGKRYIPMIISILIKHNLPTELAFIPAIESHYINGLKSPKGAAGIWQFMPQTAKTFGLVVNKYVDERLDPVKSTYAAVKYLKHLYGIFGDWKLVLASYNAGHNKIITKVSYHGSSFADIKRYLPKQTQGYILKFLAFSEEGKKIMLRSGSIVSESNFEVVSVKGSYDLKTISKLAYIPEKDLKELNRHFVKGVIPDDGNEYNLYVPKGYGKVVQAMIDNS